MAIPDRTIDDLCRRYGNWRNRPLRRGGYGSSIMHTATTRDSTKSYWQVCQQCRGTGIDLSRARTGVILQKSIECGACRGRKGRRVMVTLADPAAIPATGSGGMYVATEDTPQEFVDLEAALDGMDEKICQERGYGPRYRAVIEARYVIFPENRARQNPKERGEAARLAWANERIYPDKMGRATFGWYLTDGRRQLANVYGIPATWQDLQERSTA